MKIQDVRIATRPLVRAKTGEVDALAARLWLRFPDGYRDYVTRVGEGVLGGAFVRIYPPWKIERELSEWRRRINKYWFWDAGRKQLPKERALECVIVGDTTNGDELVFHPARPDRLFVLARDSETVFEAGDDLLSAIDWICSPGKLVEPFDERTFEPFDSRKEIDDRDAADKAPADPDGESLDDIIALAKRWAPQVAQGLKKNGAHTALSDIRESVAELAYYRGFMGVLGGATADAEASA